MDIATHYSNVKYGLSEMKGTIIGGLAMGLTIAYLAGSALLFDVAYDQREQGISKDDVNSKIYNDGLSGVVNRAFTPAINLAHRSYETKKANNIN